MISFFALWAATPWHLPLYWHLPILIILISLVYSATRFEHWRDIFTEAFRWGIRMAAFLIAIAVVLFAVSLI